MIEVTKVQKDVFLAFAKKYDPDVYAIISRGPPNGLEIRTDTEKDELELFAQKIGALILNDHPDYEGTDENINEDATMVSFIVTDMVHDYLKRSRL